MNHTESLALARHREALTIAIEKFGDRIYIHRQPQTKFAATHPIYALGEVVSPDNPSVTWWVYRVHPDSLIQHRQASRA